MAQVDAGTAGGPDAGDDKIARLKAKYWAEWAPKFPEVSTMTVPELQRRLTEDAASPGPANLVLVDVRDKPEQQVSVVASRQTLTRQDFDQRLSEFKQGPTIVCYCTVGYRSGMYAAKLLNQHGFAQEKVFNLEGSILGATQHGLELQQGPCPQQPSGHPQGPNVGADSKAAMTKKVHVWGPAFSEYAGDGYEPVVPGGKAQAGLLFSTAKQMVGHWWRSRGNKNQQAKD